MKTHRRTSICSISHYILSLFVLNTFNHGVLSTVSLVGSKGPAYVIQDSKLHLRLPQPKYTNYALMQTINDAVILAIEEKRILDEVKRLEGDNEIKIDDKKAGSSSIRSSLVGVALCVMILLSFW